MRLISRANATSPLTFEWLLELLCSSPEGMTPERVAEYRELWKAHRDEVIAACNPGQMPACWWYFDSGLGHEPEDAAERQRVLAEHGIGGVV